MVRPGPEKRFELAHITEQLVAQTQHVLAGRTTREVAMAWAQRHSRQWAQAGLTCAAAALLYCLESLAETYGDDGEPLVRVSDLAAHLADVRLGIPPFDETPFASLKLGSRELGSRVGAQVARVAIDGIGWHEAVQFASPATGRRFVALMRMASDRPLVRTAVHTAGYAKDESERSFIVSDLFDTLAIDGDDASWTEVAPAERWRLLRADDNGNQALVHEFSGYARARAALAEYEAKAHKQAYWLELAASQSRV